MVTGAVGRTTRERIGQLGYGAVGSTPEEFAVLFAAELPRVEPSS